MEEEVVAEVEGNVEVLGSGWPGSGWPGRRAVRGGR